MRLINGSIEEIQCPVPGHKPVQFASQEVVYAARSLALPPGEIVDVDREVADIVLEMRGRRGVVAMKGDETPADAIRRARRMRLAFLTKQVNDYRQTQMMRKAQGNEIQIPTDALVAALGEIGVLQKELLEQDPIMKQLLPNVAPEPLADPLKETLAQLGIPVEAMPIVPGVPSALTGIEGVPGGL